MEAQARTAPAEGREAQTETPTGPVAQEDAPQAQEAAGTPAAAVEPVADVPAAVETPLPVETPIVLQGETSTTADGAPAPTAEVPVLEGAGLEQTGVEAPVPPGGSSPMPEAAEPVLEGTEPVAGPAVDPEAAATAAASASDTETETVGRARPSQVADERQPVVPEQAQRGEQGRPAEVVRPADAPGRGVGVAAGHEQGAQAGGEQPTAGAPAAPPSQAASPSAPPAPAPAAPPAAAPAQPTGALTHPLSTQAHRVQALVELAVSRGSAMANLELHPAELGKVQVRLRSAAGGGLTATMTVDRPEALQALQQAAEQLKQSLEDRGVEVVRLDIGLSAHARGDEAKTGARSDGRDASGAGTRRGGTDAVTDHDHDDAHATVRPLIPGALVDVRA